MNSYEFISFWASPKTWTLLEFWTIWTQAPTSNGQGFSRVVIFARKGQSNLMLWVASFPCLG